MPEPSPTLVPETSEGRRLDLFGATTIGVGAIVGGGILALAGVAFASTGPSAVVAFLANGLIALATALVFAEMASSFPESGGTYTYAKKVLSVESAFMVGWVVWFASIVAAVLYALGFAAFFQIFLSEAWIAVAGSAPEWIRGQGLDSALAVAATLFYAALLGLRPGGGGQWETVGKVVLFAFLILAGIWVLPSREPSVLVGQLTPFFAHGGLGLIQAMGYTFIALQGFDLIAAVGGEVENPARTLPRAMIGSLVIALVIYIPLLLLVATIGVDPSTPIAEAAAADPEAIVPFAVEHYLGRTGFWLVIVAALLSMLSALQANLLAASHIALAMARDRNLPGRLRHLDDRRKTPTAAIALTVSMVVTLVLVLPDVAAAGAMSSLIFLISFALAHWMGILTRRRGGGEPGAFRLPWFPTVPVLGGLACASLAVFQGIVVPAAGLVGAAWLALGFTLYLLVFSKRARVADAAAEALDPRLLRLRGRNPLVLVPIANPASVTNLVALAGALAPPRLGKVLLLYVVESPSDWSDGDVPPQLAYAQEVLGRSLSASFGSGMSPQALTTIADEPWAEIRQIAATYSCESILLGLGDLASQADGKAHDLAQLLDDVSSDIVILGAPQGWNLQDVRRVLVPVGGHRDQSNLRARLLGSLCRNYELEVTYLAVAGHQTDRRQLRAELGELAEDESPGHSRLEIVEHDSVVEAVVEAARSVDLVVLGLRRRGRPIGEIPLRIAREAGKAVLLIGQTQR